eukprot:scaffold139796_cov20-Tisochrysis_lutea.AAC.1
MALPPDEQEAALQKLKGNSTSAEHLQQYSIMLAVPHQVDDIKQHLYMCILQACPAEGSSSVRDSVRLWKQGVVTHAI